MTLDILKDRLGDDAKDLKLNLGAVLSEEGAPELSKAQIHGIALASAYAIRQPELIAALQHEAADTLTEIELRAARAAANIMAMNNVYYRFVHLLQDRDYSAMPAKLRMNVIGAPGVAKLDFELYCLAVSAINGCGMCMEAHAHEITKAGMPKLAVQSAVRIAAVLSGVAQALEIHSLAADPAKSAAA